MPNPNILLLTVGSANSTVCIRMCAAAGWNLGQVDDQYAEHIEAHRINRRIMNGHGFAEPSARKMLAELPTPWVMKDPLFCHTLRHWRPLLEPYRPALVWITKDLEYVRKSFQRRFKLPPELADQRQQWCQAYFDSWPWGKVQLDVDEIAAAIRLFQPDRIYSGGEVPINGCS